MDRTKRTVVYAALAMAMAALAGCNAQMPPEAQQMLTVGLDAYEAGDDDAVIEGMDRFIAEYPRVRGVEQAYYLRGLTHYRADRIDLAWSDLAEAVGRSDDGVLRAKARVTLGDIAYDGDDISEAEDHYRRALDDVGQEQAPADHARYRLGSVLQRQGRWREADLHFNRVIYAFPHSRFAAPAERRVHARAWTIQAGAFNQRSNADVLADTLRAAGLDAEARATLAESGPRYVVQVGRYDSYDAAAAALENVHRHEPQAFVTVTR